MSQSGNRKPDLVSRIQPVMAQCFDRRIGSAKMRLVLALTLPLNIHLGKPQDSSLHELNY